MPEAKHITSLMPYASSDDFRRIFYEGNDSLHRLSFLLTADREKPSSALSPDFRSQRRAARFSRSGHTHGLGGRSFKAP